MSPTPPICTECRHFRRRVSHAGLIKTGEDLMCARREPILNVVTGVYEPHETNAAKEREDVMLCGRHGKYFEPIDPAIQRKFNRDVIVQILLIMSIPIVLTYILL